MNKGRPFVVEIDPETWYCGRRMGSQLCRKDGHNCCLGFAGEQAGLPHESMVGHGDFWEYLHETDTEGTGEVDYDVVPVVLGFLLDGRDNSEIGQRLMNINDVGQDTLTPSGEPVYLSHKARVEMLNAVAPDKIQFVLKAQS